MAERVQAPRRRGAPQEPPRAQAGWNGDQEAEASEAREATAPVGSLVDGVYDMRAIILAAALTMAGAAQAAPPVDMPSTSHDERDERMRHIYERASELMPLKTFKVRWIHNRDDGTSVYMIAFDTSKLPGAPRVISNGIVVRPGQGLQVVDEALAKIARELQQIIDNTKAGRPWNAGVTPERPIEPSF